MCLLLLCRLQQAPLLAPTLSTTSPRPPLPQSPVQKQHHCLKLLCRLQQAPLPAASPSMTPPQAACWQCSGCLQDRGQSRPWQPGWTRSCYLLLRWQPLDLACLMEGACCQDQMLGRLGGGWVERVRRMQPLVSAAAVVVTKAYCWHAAYPTFLCTAVPGKRQEAG